MTPPLYFVEALDAADTIALTGAEAHHAGTVKRPAVGEVVLLSDGSGQVARAEAVEVSRERIVFAILERSDVPQRSPRLVVVQALPKGDRGELAIEVLTELGVDEIVPWSASRSITQWRADKAVRGVEKWRRVAVEASKQSRRPVVPVVAGLATSPQVGRRIERATVALVLHEGAEQTLGAVSLPTSGEVLVIVGPEGGVSDDELAQFAAAGAVAVRLGPEVLRTSTAGAAALSVLSDRLGRWH